MTLRVRRGATALTPLRRRLIAAFPEMPPTREVSAALGMAIVAFIAWAFDVKRVKVEVREAKSRGG